MTQSRLVSSFFSLEAVWLPPEPSVEAQPVMVTVTKVTSSAIKEI